MSGGCEDRTTESLRQALKVEGSGMENLITLSKHLALFLVATIHGFGPRLFSAQKVKAMYLSIYLQHNPPHPPIIVVPGNV